MSDATMTFDIRFTRGRRGRKRLAENTATTSRLGSIPRVTKLMALAIRWDGQLRRGELKDCAAIARVGNVTRARVSQIMALLNLASDLQEAILFLEADRLRCGCVTERKMRDVCAMPSWERQRDALGPALTRTPAGGRASESAR